MEPPSHPDAPLDGEPVDATTDGRTPSCGVVDAGTASPIEISIVVPVFDEEENLPKLHAEIVEHVGGMGVPWEVVYVDDRSRDTSFEVLLRLRESDPHVRVVRFRRNYGQTPAMAAGFEQSRGRIVVTMDADLQNDPVDVPALVAKLDEGDGYDVVVGWRKNRKDGLWLRKVPSRIANRLIARSTGATVHDTGCTLKAFRRELVENLPIYAEQHRFLPVLSLASGARIAEVVVNHRPRIHGQSKYGIGRAARVVSDLLAMKMLASFATRPLNYFALLALPFLGAPAVYLFLASLEPGRLTLVGNWGHAVMLTFVVVTMAGVYFLLLGLLAELIVKVGGRNDGPLRSTGVTVHGTGRRGEGSPA